MTLHSYRLVHRPISVLHAIFIRSWVLKVCKKKMDLEKVSQTVFPVWKRYGSFWVRSRTLWGSHAARKTAQSGVPLFLLERKLCTFRECHSITSGYLILCTKRSWGCYKYKFVKIEKCSYFTSWVWFVFLNGSTRLCFESLLSSWNKGKYFVMNRKRYAGKQICIVRFD